MSKSPDEIAMGITVAWLQAIGNAAAAAEPSRLLRVISPRVVAAAHRTFLQALYTPLGDPLPVDDTAAEAPGDAEAD